MQCLFLHYTRQNSSTLTLEFSATCTKSSRAGRQGPNDMLTQGMSTLFVARVSIKAEGELEFATKRVRNDVFSVALLANAHLPLT